MNQRERYIENGLFSDREYLSVVRYQKADDDARDVRVQMTVDDDSDGDDDIMSQTSLHCRQRHTHSLRHRQRQQQQQRKETERAREGRNAEHRETDARDRGAESRRYATAARPNYR